MIVSRFSMSPPKTCLPISDTPSDSGSVLRLISCRMVFSMLRYQLSESRTVSRILAFGQWALIWRQ